MPRTLWQASGAAQLEWAHWDEESVLFDRRSGQTHILTATATEALMHLQTGCCDAEQLADHLARTFRLPTDKNLTGQVEALLARLNELGLVEPSKD